MDPTVITYFVYLAICLLLTVWVARTLFKNGRRFLIDVFAGKDDLADSVNRLLLVGFYLVNLGYVSLALRIDEEVANTRESIEALSWKVGLVLLVLGEPHFRTAEEGGRRLRERAFAAEEERGEEDQHQPPAKAPQVIPVPEVPQLMAEDHGQFVLR